MKEVAVAENGNYTNGGTDKDTLLMLSGVAFIVFGAGLILSNPLVRKYLGQVGIGNLAQAALPDIDRYLRLRQM
jgi:hypothetical protein